MLPVNRGPLPTPSLDKLTSCRGHCISAPAANASTGKGCCSPTLSLDSLLQEGASCGPSCGPTSASKPGLQAHLMCEQLAHRVRQLSHEKQVCLCCLAAASSAGEVPVDSLFTIGCLKLTWKCLPPDL